MTVLIGMKCIDGVVIACDSMLTVGGFAQQTGQKLHLIPGPPQQLYAFAGDLALAERFRAVATANANMLQQQVHKLLYATNIGNFVVQNFQATGLDPLKADLATVLAFVKDGIPEICQFNFGSQPRFLDEHHYCCIFGSGQVAATPFLKFLTDTLLEDRQPNLAEGKLLATWGVKYAINTLCQGVGYPIDIATIERDHQSNWSLQELGRQDVDETLEAIQSASDALKKWRDGLSTIEDIEDIPDPNKSNNGGDAKPDGLQDFPFSPPATKLPTQ